jgi:hypothetical protein
MERLFGVSYPTIKARLNRLAERLGAELEVVTPTAAASPADRREVLDRLERGEISAQQALEALTS